MIIILYVILFFNNLVRMSVVKVNKSNRTIGMSGKSHARVCLYYCYRTTDIKVDLS